MHHHTSNISNHLSRIKGHCDLAKSGSRHRRRAVGCSPPGRRTSYLASLLFLILAIHPAWAQKASPGDSARVGSGTTAVIAPPPQPPAAPTKTSITINEAVSIFLQKNLHLAAARYDISTAEAEKLSARLRPNPEITVGSSGLPINFAGP